MLSKINFDTEMPMFHVKSDLLDTVERIGESFVHKANVDAPTIDDVCMHTETFRRRKEIKMKNTGDPIYDECDYTYLQNLRARAKALVQYLLSNDNYKTWRNNWVLLERNLNKHIYYFEQLKESDEDIAHVINKGDQIRFRIRDNSGLYIPINIYQYVMCHELAHMATNETQHTATFWKLLYIMSFAMFEMGFYDFHKIRKNTGYFNSNGQPILSLESIKKDINRGIEEMKKVNGARFDYGLYVQLLGDS